MPSTQPPDRPVHALPSWPRLLVAIVVGAGVVAACGGGGTAAPGGGTAAPASGAPAASAPAQSAAPAATQAPAGGGIVDVCALLSVADVKSITGSDTNAVVETTDWDEWVAGECWWSSENMTVRFGVDVGTPASIAKSSSPTAQEQYDLSKLAMTGMSPEDIPGLGDQAFAIGGFIWVRKGDYFFDVFGSLTKDQLIEVARLLLAKL